MARPLRAWSGLKYAAMYTNKEEPKRLVTVMERDLVGTLINRQQGRTLVTDRHSLLRSAYDDHYFLIESVVNRSAV